MALSLSVGTERLGFARPSHGELGLLNFLAQASVALRRGPRETSVLDNDTHLLQRRAGQIRRCTQRGSGNDGNQCQGHQWTPVPHSLRPHWAMIRLWAAQQKKKMFQLSCSTKEKKNQDKNQPS